MRNLPSRPEYWISDLFEIGVLSGVTKRLSLRDDKDTDIEIENYLREGFDDIYGRNIDIMSPIERPWPPDRIIKRFVEESSGQFVYPSTVLKFVGDSSNFCHPQEQLLILTTAGPHRASAFTSIDKLYASILSAYPRISTLKLVLGGILLDLSPKTIQYFLGLETGEFQLVLRALSSLIDISTTEYDEAYRILEPVFGSPLVESKISFCHLSFREFLEDESRSDQYSIDIGLILQQLLTAILCHGTDILRNSSEADQTIARYSAVAHVRNASVLIMFHLFYSIGLNAYRIILKRLPHLQWSRCQNFLALEGLLHKFNLTFQAHSADSAHVPYTQPELVYWFAVSMSGILNDLRTSWKSSLVMVYRKNKDLINTLGDAIHMVRDISLEQLLEIPFQHTITFTHLASYGPCMDNDVDCIPDIMETMAVSLPTILLDLQSHRNLFHLQFHNTQTLQIHTGYGELLLSVICHLQDVDAKSQHVMEWYRRRTELSAQCFRELFHNGNKKEICRLESNLENVRIAGRSLRQKPLSDINSHEWFNDLNKTEIFNILMDTSLWDNSDEETSTFLASDALCWFNRQLKGTARNVIEEYDSSLPQRMIVMMRWIFEQKFLPQFTGPYCTNLWMYSDQGSSPCIELHPMPPSDERSKLCAKMELKQLVDIGLPECHADPVMLHYHITDFNNEVMSGEEGHLIISPADWYPHLTTFLLTMLVKKRYARSHNGFETLSGWRGFTETIFLTLIKSIPYGYPTQQNLNALRALHYLSPRTCDWRPPFGFCSQAMKFLKKYDRSLLSSHESDLLQDWLLHQSARESHRIVLCENELVDNDDDYTTDEDDETGDESTADKNMQNVLC